MSDVATLDLEASTRDELDPGLTGGYLGPKLRVLWNLLSARMAVVLAPYGLRSGAYSTMALIMANPGCSQNQLARALCMDKSAVVAILDDLEERGIAMRVRPPNDRRRHALQLTKEGEELMRRMAGPASLPGKPIRDSFSKAEMDQLLTLLDRAYDALAAAEELK